MNGGRLALRSGMFTPRALVAFTFFLLGVSLGVFSLASGTQSSWAIVDSPNSRPTATDNFPLGVTCVSASDCWAVGYYDNGANQTVIQHWNGTSWIVVSSPNTSPIQNNLLRGVTCNSASDCWAVGSYDNGGVLQTLIEHWDGNGWTIVPSPNTSASQSNFLSGVTCTSALNCWAVGSYLAGSTYQTLIQRWNGTAWTIVTSSNTSASQNNFLSGVTCTSASNCWAVGSFNSTFAEQTLIERWDGTAWTIVTSPNVFITQNNILLGVTCASASDCWAIGYSNNSVADQTLIERWNGTSWSVVTSPNTLLTQTNRLLSVTCASASDCWTVGYSNDGSIDRTLIQRWNGASWAIANSPNTDPAQNNTLAAVTCASASDCWTVGFYNNGSVQQSLIERWNGTAWTILTSPNSNAAQNNTLLGVTCVSASDCWAVASYYNGSVQQTLIQHWDGNEWTIVTSPNTSTAQSNLLYDVTCVSASDCWAIGYYLAGSAWQALIQHWDGNEWSIVTSPSTGATQNNFLNAITCNSASDCWAVGFYDNGIVYQTLILHWNGTLWTIATSPNTDTANENRLFGVACSSASDCWAVGRYFNGIALQTLIQRWNGTSWTIVSSPNTSASQENDLNGVTCASASDCWAVGSYGLGSGTGQTLIARWNGTSWAIISSPNPSETQPTYNFLKAVTCASTSDCWAVGYHFMAGAYRTLIERWNGTSWAIVSSPNTSATQNNFLFGVTCVTASDCWATGYHYDESGVIQTLTQHYLPPVPTNVVSRKAHGSAGTFDINLPLTGGPGIECRKGQGANSDEHQIVLTFIGPATVTSVTCDGKPATSSSAGNNLTVNCSAVENGKVITIALTGVTVGGNSDDVSVQMGMLLGDVNVNKVVSNTDVAAVKAQVSSPVTESNFRSDVNANGIVSNTDVSVTKAQVSTTLP